MEEGVNVATVDTLEVKIKASIYIDDTTADLCLKVVQMYLRQHDEIKVAVDHDENGEVKLYYEPRR